MLDSLNGGSSQCGRSNPGDAGGANGVEEAIHIHNGIFQLSVSQSMHSSSSSIWVTFRFERDAISIMSDGVSRDDGIKNAHQWEARSQNAKCEHARRLLAGEVIGQTEDASALFLFFFE
jgi:hypothetical protein